MNVLTVFSTLLVIHSTAGQTFESCQPYYPVTVGQQVSGSVAAAGVTTEAACKSACDADTGCIGFDINTAGANPFCALTKVVTVPLTAQANVNHYTRSQACPFPLKSKRCFYSYRGVVGIATGQLGPTSGATASECMGSCSYFTPCTAAIFNTGTDQCFIYFAVVDQTALVAVASNQYYQQTACDTVPLGGTCSEIYIKTANLARADGTLYLNNKTVEACEITCNASSTCLGYDFNTVETACYIHTNATKTESVKPNVDNYRSGQQCTTTADTCTYKSFVDYIPASKYVGTAVPGIISVSECLASCNEDGDECVGIIFNINFNSNCEKYLKATVTTAPTQNLNAFIENAAMVKSTSGQVGYGRGSCATTVTVAPTTAPGACDTFAYRTMPGKHLAGATELTTSNDVVTCQTACTNNPICWGLDFNSGDNSCWLFYSTSAVTPYTPPTDSTIGTEAHYEKYLPCADCEYNFFDGVENSLRIAKTSYNTQTACVTACSADSSCKGIDYQTVTNACYFHTNVPTPSTTTANGNFRQYVKTACSGTVVGGCNFNRFVEYPGMKIPGGTAIDTTPKDATQCELKCITNGQCYSFDLNSSGSCFIVTTFAIMQSNVNGENHFQREPECNFTSSVDCRYFHTGKYEPNDAGAKISTTVKSKELCFESCIDVNLCSGLTWDRDTTSCVIYNTQVPWDVASLKDSANTNREGYQFKGCSASSATTVATTTVAVTTTTVAATTTTAGGCVGGTWTEKLNMHAKNGILQSQLTTLDACRQGCIDSTNCVGVDATTTGTPIGCWFHNNIDDINAPTPENNVNLNVLTRCGDSTTPTSGACTPSFIKQALMKQPSGTSISANSLAACQDFCQQESSCASLDYQTTTNQCYTHNTVTTPVSSGSETVDNYRKNLECAGCSYKNYPNMRYTNGDPMPQYNTLQSCLNACSSHPTCVCVDFRASPVVCDFFYTIVTMNLITASGFEHWSNDGNKPCAGTTVPGGTTAPPGSVCVDDYSVSIEHKFQGVMVPDTFSLDACKAWCNAQDECAGFDYNTVNTIGACWWHKSNDGLVPATDGSSHYSKVTTCGECMYDVYVKKMVNNVIGTTKSAATMAACLSYCNDDDNCKSSDYDRTTQTCNLFPSVYKDLLVASSNGVHYERTSCPCSADVEYETSENFKVMEGQLVIGISTVDDCEDDCDVDPKCIGFDFNTGKQCWKTPSDNRNGLVPSAEGVTHYTKLATCGGCRYDIMGAQSAPGNSGTLQPASIDTWKSCISVCTGDASCQSVDFIENTKQCYLFSAAFNTGLSINNDANHYIKVFCGQATATGGTTSAPTGPTVSGANTPIPVTCTTDYNTFEGQKVVGGTPVANVRTLEDCLLNCRANIDCVGFDFDRKPNANSGFTPCWIQTDNNKVMQPHNPNAENVIHYSVQMTCGGCTFKPFSKNRPTNYAIMLAYTNEDQCVGGCSSADTCKTASFQGNQCLHGTDTALTSVANSVSWEKSDTCTTPTQTTPSSSEGMCSESYIRYPNLHVSGGARSAPNVDNSTCAAACDANSSCTGYDISTVNNNCWLTISRDAQKVNYADATNVDHYAKVLNCVGICYRQIQLSTFATSTPFGEPTRYGCLLSCNIRTDCRDVIYNADVSENKCRLIGTDTVVSIPDLPAGDRTYYSRLTDCNEGAGQA